MTAATAAVTLSCLFTEWLCFVLGRLHSSYVLSTRMGLYKVEVINIALVNYDFSKIEFSLCLCSENFSFQSYQNKNL